MKLQAVREILVFLGSLLAVTGVAMVIAWLKDRERLSYLASCDRKAKAERSPEAGKRSLANYAETQEEWERKRVGIL